MSQDDQVVSVRLRRSTTSTPWGFRMQGGNEYGSTLFIQKINPKSLSARQGLRIGDRLLAIGDAQAHKMTHEQAKMEIIRAGNEVDILVQRVAGASDQVDSAPVQRPKVVQPVEESTEYRGYTNPNVQSRSFKILQESLHYSEADEAGMKMHQGVTPGEGVVFRAYNEGKRRMEELMELNPRNFTAEGESPYRYKDINEVSSNEYETRFKGSQSPRQENAPPANANVATAKQYSGVESAPRKRPQPQTAPVNLAHSSVFAPAAAQQQYVQQAQDNYHLKQQNRPLKLVNQNFEQQYGHQRREPTALSSQKSQKMTTVVQNGSSTGIVVTPTSATTPKSAGFIPTTKTVSSVAVDLDLKHETTATKNVTTNKATVQNSVQQVSTSVTTKTTAAKSVQKTKVDVNPVSVATTTSTTTTKVVETPQTNVKVKVTEHVADTLAKTVIEDAKTEASTQKAATTINSSVTSVQQKDVTVKSDETDGACVSKSTEATTEVVSTKTTETNIESVIETVRPQKPEIKESAPVAESEIEVKEEEVVQEVKKAKVEVYEEKSVSEKNIVEENKKTIVDQLVSTTESSTSENIVVSSEATTEEVSTKITETNVESVDETVKPDEPEIIIPESKPNATTALPEVKTEEIISDAEVVVEKKEETTSSISENIVISAEPEVAVETSNESTEASFAISNDSETQEVTTIVVAADADIVVDSNVDSSSTIVLDQSSTEEANFSIDTSAETSLVIEESFCIAAQDESEFTIEIQSDDVNASTTEANAEISLNVQAEESITIEPESETNTEVKTVTVEQSKQSSLYQSSSSDSDRSPNKSPNKSPNTLRRNPLDGLKKVEKPGRTKFTDSQGGVSGRMAKFNLKK